MVEVEVKVETQINPALTALSQLLDSPMSDWQAHTVPQNIWPKENSGFIHANPRTKRLYVHEGYAGQSNQSALLAQQAARVALAQLVDKYGPDEQTMPYHGQSSNTMPITGLSRQPQQAEAPSNSPQSPREDVGSVMRTRGFAKA
jgi:hypothetical protein